MDNLDKKEKIKIISDKFNICTSLASDIYDDLESRGLLDVFMKNSEGLYFLSDLLNDFYDE